MKAVTLTLTFLSGIHAFAPTNPSSTTTSPNHGLQMTSSTTNNEEVSRRTALTQFIASTAFLTAAVPSIASAKDYEPDYRDIKQIYGLGMTLDNLKVKVSDPDTSATALDMVKMYNKDQKFYPGYARNFISKTVKNNADGDDRVGYIRAASASITSLEGLLDGSEGLRGKEASKEAVTRVAKAQSLISKFLKGSGVTDEKVAAFVKAHP